MGYRSEVSVIVGKKVDKQIKALVKRFTKAAAEGKVDKDDLDTLKSFMFNRTVSSCGNLVRYYHARIKWNTDCVFDNPCLYQLEKLVKMNSCKCEPGYEASFIRIGDDDEDREEVSNIYTQSIGIVVSGEFLNEDEVDCAIDDINKQIDALTHRLDMLRKGKRTLHRNKAVVTVK